jgi:hypothetical protein
MNFHIISCGWFTSEQYAIQCIARNLESVRDQTFGRWWHYVLLDGGTDAFGNSLAGFASDEREFGIVTDRRRGMARNTFEVIQMINGNPDDVAVMLDLDDRFAVDTALSTLAIEYDDPECWVTHGSFRKLSGGATKLNRSMLHDMSPRVQSWCMSHCKTFRLGLAKKLKMRDFKDKANQWIMAAADLALMYPIIEMAGTDRVRFVPEVIYEYNDTNPLADQKVAYDEQKRMTDMLVRRPAKKRIEAYT